MIELYHIQREGDPYGGSRNSSKVLIALEEIGENIASNCYRGYRTVVRPMRLIAKSIPTASCLQSVMMV